jgi:uncharacterized protein (DUF2336 family)
LSLALTEHIAQEARFGIVMTQLAANTVSDRVTALMQLAHKAEPESRAYLYNSVADLMVARGDRLNNHERTLVRQILALLTRQVETAVRRALALRLAERSDAPHDLILMLANDSIAVAEPVISSSPVLTDADLILIIRHASSAHRHIVARRPAIGARVSEALIEHGNDNVLAALLSNQSAMIPVEALRLLLNRAALNTTLQPALVERADLPPEILDPLYKMVSGVLKAHLQAHYAIQSSVIDKALPEAIADARAGAPDDSEAHAVRLIDKLDRARTLGPSFLVKALNEGQSAIFFHAFARLLKSNAECVRKLVALDDPRALALATRAVNIDRSVFLDIYRQLRPDKPQTLDASQKSFLDEVFIRMSAQDAVQRLSRGGLLQPAAQSR